MVAPNCGLHGTGPTRDAVQAGDAGTLRARVSAGRSPGSGTVPHKLYGLRLAAPDQAGLHPRYPAGFHPDLRGAGRPAAGAPASGGQSAWFPECAGLAACTESPGAGSATQPALGRHLRVPWDPEREPATLGAGRAGHSGGALLPVLVGTARRAPRPPRSPRVEEESLAQSGHRLLRPAANTQNEAANQRWS